MPTLVESTLWFLSGLWGEAMRRTGIHEDCHESFLEMKGVAEGWQARAEKAEAKLAAVEAVSAARLAGMQKAERDKQCPACTGGE